ncbi:hypothetical protein N5853_14450 (plasmid) [Bartonella sp. HY329]|uniref:hypothetical protein n=1 Tax=unclassified Bartonella TaxID=2645622 RepID=UPI0021C88182|nr:MULTISPECIES: hypothetical protein [unclassified Bartonella]UXM96517.1 hypothetical protein N5853_14450 [Bartonella sp. HY329]UXN10840.1 hypothetical protein N5852_14455 [Bartonella sp. HY328]
MLRMILILIFGIITLLSTAALKAEERVGPPFSYLDGTGYTTKQMVVYDCPSKKCNKIEVLPIACVVDYYEPSDSDGYGDWIRIRRFSCIKNNSIFASDHIDGYIEDDLSYEDAIEALVPSKEKNKYNLMLCNYDCFVLKSEDFSYKEDLVDSNCSIGLTVVNQLKNSYYWLPVDNVFTSCQFKKYKDYTIVWAQFLKPVKK